MKIQLLGIAIILFGIAWYMMLSYMGQLNESAISTSGLIISAVGLFVTAIGLFKRDTQ